MSKWAEFLDSFRDRLNSIDSKDDEHLEMMINELEQKHQEMKEFIRKSTRVRLEHREVDLDAAYLLCSERLLD